MINRDIHALKLLGFTLWLIILDIGLLQILHGLGYVAIPFLSAAP